MGPSSVASPFPVKMGGKKIHQKMPTENALQLAAIKAPVVSLFGFRNEYRGSG